jgi:hypothetical protein
MINHGRTLVNVVERIPHQHLHDHALLYRPLILGGYVRIDEHVG